MYFNLLIAIAEGVMMLFMFRSLLQSSSASYYHPITQVVIKLTNFAVNFAPIRNFRFKSFSFAGFFVAFVISLLFWFLVPITTNDLPFLDKLLLAVLMFIKSFGYLLLALLIVQALCSWLEATRNFAYYLSETTSVIVAPIQKIIPPIGMIDISLMLIVLAIFFLNRLMLSIFSYMWLIL